MDRIEGKVATRCTDNARQQADAGPDMGRVKIS